MMDDIDKDVRECIYIGILGFALEALLVVGMLVVWQ